MTLPDSLMSRLSRTGSSAFLLNGWVTAELTDWGTLAGYMPLLATGVILALLCLGLALSPLNGERSPVARIPCRRPSPPVLG